MVRAGLLSLELRSNPRNISMIDGFVQKLVEEFKLSPNQYGNILISLTEAVNNAIIHGNSKDESKKVQIQLRRLKNKLAISVSDQGRGFDPNNVSDPCCAENIEECGGRGVLIMRELSDNMSYSNNGRTVEMQFKIR
ncbi:MAG: ATP-binding protein [Bacteroidetes bacterium]|nr:MAG: ATP-binding protein [Bacteroidota bacterium]